MNYLKSLLTKVHRKYYVRKVHTYEIYARGGYVSEIKQVSAVSATREISHMKQPVH